MSTAVLCYLKVIKINNKKKLILLPNNTPAAFREIINRKRTIKIHEHMQIFVHMCRLKNSDDEEKQYVKH